MRSDRPGLRLPEQRTWILFMYALKLDRVTVTSSTFGALVGGYRGCKAYGTLVVVWLFEEASSLLKTCARC
jgi:hypothetical protein